MRYFLLVFCTLYIKPISAQDIRGVHTHYKWLSGYTYSVTATLFTDSASTKVRNSIYVQGVGTFPLNSVSTSGKIRIRRFSGTKTYSGTGYNKLAINDSLRIAGIKNITNSQFTAIHIENELNIDATLGPNNSPVITNYPVNFNLSGNNVTYNPGLVDPDGDSLSYSQNYCSGTLPFNYYYPGGSTIDNYGTLSFSKDSIGIYAFAYEITEWRFYANNYIAISTSKYDFALDINSGVGINEIESQRTLSLYPNPTSSILNIKSNSNNNSKLEIINCLGQTVLKQNYSANIDVSGLVPGCYFIRVDNSYSRFIKE